MESDDFVLLGVTFDSKMTFEKHLRMVSIAASQWLRIWSKSYVADVGVLQPILGWSVVLQPILEYCSAVWCSVTDKDPKLLDRAVSGAWF